MVLEVGQDKGCGMSWVLSFSMYFLSFAPLWLTVLFVDIKSLGEGGYNKWTEIISITCILVMALFTLVCLFFYLCKSSGDTVCKYELKKARESKTITSEFLLSYILPLFAFDFTRWDGAIEFLIFFIVLGYLCIRHNYFSVNIILEILGFKMYECILINEDGCDKEKIVISKRSLAILGGHEIVVKTINNEFFLDTKDKENDI